MLIGLTKRHKFASSASSAIIKSGKHFTQSGKDIWWRVSGFNNVINSLKMLKRNIMNITFSHDYFQKFNGGN